MYKDWEHGTKIGLPLNPSHKNRWHDHLRAPLNVAIAAAACHDGGMKAASTSGRLAPRPFAIAVLVLYLVSFGSQILLSPPVTRWAGVWAFAVIQAVLIWTWIVLHANRLRDAGRPTGLAIGIACVYALEVLLLLLLVWTILSAGFNRPDEPATQASILHLFVILYLLAMLTGDPHLGELQVWMVGLAALMVLPVLVAICFSFWTGTRPRMPWPAPSS
jgi:hypothetical protein